MSDRPSILERIQRASESRNLAVVPDREGDADYLAALGMGSRPFAAGSTLMRIHMAGRPADYRDARQAVIALTQRMSAQRNWNLADHNIVRVAELALAHHVFPTCPACAGRGYELQPGVARLSSRACQPCLGSGRRRVQRRWHDHIRDVMGELDNLDAIIGRAVARKLR